MSDLTALLCAEIAERELCARWLLEPFRDWAGVLTAIVVAKHARLPPSLGAESMIMIMLSAREWRIQGSLGQVDWGTYRAPFMAVMKLAFVMLVNSDTPAFHAAGSAVI